MCIRDRIGGVTQVVHRLEHAQARRIRYTILIVDHARYLLCLLYTSDAADERSSVDLGGRRIIKKKKYIAQMRTTMTQT